MLKRLVAICALGLTAVSLDPTTGQAQAATQNVAFLGCQVPASGGAGMGVYSFEAYGSTGKWIATELAATKDDVSKLASDFKCSAALSKLIGSAKGCPSGSTWAPMFPPSFNSTANTGYALNLFTFTCQKPVMPPA